MRCPEVFVSHAPIGEWHDEPSLRPRSTSDMYLQSHLQAGVAKDG